VQKAFTPRLVEGLRPRIHALANELMDRAKGGRMELVGGFALPEDRIHAPDESYRIESLELGLRAARALFEELATAVGDAPPQRPRPLSQDALLGLFSAHATGRDVVLEPATLFDMCGREDLARPSLEVVYDAA